MRRYCLCRFRRSYDIFICLSHVYAAVLFAVIYPQLIVNSAGAVGNLSRCCYAVGYIAVCVCRELIKLQLIAYQIPYPVNFNKGRNIGKCILSINVCYRVIRYSRSINLIPIVTVIIILLQNYIQPAVTIFQCGVIYSVIVIIIPDHAAYLRSHELLDTAVVIAGAVLLCYNVILDSFVSDCVFADIIIIILRFFLFFACEFLSRSCGNDIFVCNSHIQRCIAPRNRNNVAVDSVSDLVFGNGIALGRRLHSQLIACQEHLVIRRYRCRNICKCVFALCVCFYFGCAYKLPVSVRIKIILIQINVQSAYTAFCAVLSSVIIFIIPDKTAYSRFFHCLDTAVEVLYRFNCRYNIVSVSFFSVVIISYIQIVITLISTSDSSVFGCLCKYDVFALCVEIN